MINTILFLANTKVFGIEIIDYSDLLELLVRFAFNFIATTVIIRYLYYTTTKRKDYLFTYILLSTTIFLLIFMLESVKMKIGFALGLFAIFGIIRYRTNPIPIKEMTYLFVVIGLSVINAMSSKKISYAELLLVNIIIISIIYLLEKVWLLKHESSKVILFEKIELIKPEKHQELIADLEERTGIKISRIEIGKINFLKDTARVKIFYFETDQSHQFEDEDYIVDDDD